MVVHDIIQTVHLGLLMKLATPPPPLPPHPAQVTQAETNQHFTPRQLIFISNQTLNKYRVDRTNFDPKQSTVTAISTGICKARI